MTWRDDGTESLNENKKGEEEMNQQICTTS